LALARSTSGAGVRAVGGPEVGPVPRPKHSALTGITKPVNKKARSIAFLVLTVVARTPILVSHHSYSIDVLLA